MDPIEKKYFALLDGMDVYQAWQLYLVEPNKDGIFILKFDSQSNDYDHLLSYADYITKHGGTTYIIPAPGDPNAKE